VGAHNYVRRNTRAGDRPATSLPPPPFVIPRLDPGVAPSERALPIASIYFRGYYLSRRSRLTSGVIDHVRVPRNKTLMLLKPDELLTNPGSIGADPDTPFAVNAHSISLALDDARQTREHALCAPS